MSPRFNGDVYDPAKDDQRLTRQIGRVYAAMCDEEWHTLNELAEVTGDPVASISAQIRHLRKPRFGGYRVDKRVRELPGLWEYRLARRVMV